MAQRDEDRLESHFAAARAETPVPSAALLDRITHKAHVISCSWESYRLRDTLKKR